MDPLPQPDRFYYIVTWICFAHGLLPIIAFNHFWWLQNRIGIK